MPSALASKRLRLLLLGWLLLSPGLWTRTAWASAQIIVMGPSSNLPTTNNTTNYYPLMGIESSWNTTESSRNAPCGMAGTMTNLRVSITAASGAGVTRTFTVRENVGATVLSCAISGASDTSCTDTDSESFTAGAKLAMEMAITGGTAAAADAHWTVQLDGSTAAESCYSGTNVSGGATATGTEYYNVARHRDGDSTDALAAHLVSTGGAWSDLYAELATAPGAGASRVFTVFVEGSGTVVTCTISDAATTCNDPTNSIAISEGNTFSIQQVPSTPTNPAVSTSVLIGMVFTATTDGEFLFPGRDITQSSTAATDYLPLMGIVTGTTTETDMSGLAQGMTITDLNVEIDGSPGVAPRAYTYTLRQNVGDASLTCTITAGNTTCAGETDVSIAADDLLAFSVTPSATAPSGRTPLLCATGFISQAAGARRVMLISKEETLCDSRFFWRSCPSRN